MAYKEIKTWIWVFWLLVAIIGTGLLFVGIQNTIFGDNLTLSIMLILVGVILVFVSLSYVIGHANIAYRVERKEETEPETKNENE